MNEAAALTFAAAVPFLLLGLLLWLARLEETLGDGLDASRTTRQATQVAGPALTIDADAVPPIPAQPVAPPAAQPVASPVAAATAAA
jgi:hypothetical protein